jgi:hypothetical protein
MFTCLPGPVRRIVGPPGIFPGDQGEVFMRKKTKIAVGLCLTLFGTGVAVAQERCPSVCYQDCTGDAWCSFAQWLAGCHRMVCEG